MKTNHAIYTLLLALTLCVGPVDAKAPQRIIFETDMGNDVDDALALDMLYHYQAAHKVTLLSVMVNKPGIYPVEYIDILNTYYGHEGLPIGKISNGANCETDGVNYAKAVCMMKGADGKPLFKRSMSNYASLIEAPRLYRRILAKQPDHSVTIISTGFSTNLARLLQTKADSYSKLNGRQLVARKVSRLVIMGGNFSNSNPEYNILRDIPSAQYVFQHWPTRLVTSPFDVGEHIKYPGRIIASYSGKPQPVIEGYKAYLKMPYDRPSWDMTAVLYAVEGGKWFGISGHGTITAQDNGSTTFLPSSKGLHQYLTTTDEQRKAILNHLITLIKF